MARKAILTCPNCGVKIEYITLHRGKVLGWRRKRERRAAVAFADAISGSKSIDSKRKPQTGE